MKLQFFDTPTDAAAWALDGVYVDARAGPSFRWVKAPTRTELTQLSHTIARRVGRFLERQGLLVRDDEAAYLTADTGGDDPMDTLIGHSITYRIATGSRRGRKVLTLQSLPAIDEPFTTRAGNVAGFSLHAGVAAKAHERNKLERLCRYITRPAVSEKRLSLTEHGNVRYTLKTPWRDGTTHVIFESLDFIARLAALVPRPRVNLTRFHGVFAPNSQHRALITPAGRGKGQKHKVTEQEETRTPAERHAAMTWAQRLKRVFSIDIETCQACGGAVKIMPKALAALAGQALACIEDPGVIRRILDHLDRLAPTTEPDALPEPRAPPQVGLFDTL